MTRRVTCVPAIRYTWTRAKSPIEDSERPPSGGMPTVATCSVRITDDLAPAPGVAVVLLDDDGAVMVSVNRAQLLDDPEGVMVEVFASLNVCANHYLRMHVAAA